MIHLKEIKGPKEVRQFVMFPFELYKDHEFWVPPIISQEIASFDKNQNAFSNDSVFHLFLAYNGDEIVGRIAIIINKAEVHQQGIKKIRFGWFDFIDDFDVSKKLIEKVVEIGKKHELVFMEGPLGFSSMDKAGLLTEGFDYMNSMVTWYNYPYYQKHYEKLDLKSEKFYLENKFKMSDVEPSHFIRMSKIIQEKYLLKALNFINTKHLHPYLNEMFDMFNTTYSSLESFVPISEEHKKYLVKKFIKFVNPDYVKFVVDKDQKMVAFSVVMPSFSQALKKANGKLFPFGFYHLLKAKRQSKSVDFYLIGVHPDYQKKGVTAIIFEEYYHLFKKKGIENCYRMPELATNKSTALIWKHFSPVNYKKRCTFSKEL